MSIIGGLPYNLTNGTVADATQVMSDFNLIVSSVNANAAPLTAASLTSPSISSGAISGSAVTTSTINSSTIGATTPSTGAFTTLSATTSLNVTAAGTSQAYFGSTGTNISNVNIDTGTTGQASQLNFTDAGVTKWTVSKTSALAFSIYDPVGSKTFISAVTSGALTLGPAQTTTLSQGGDLLVQGAPFCVQGGFKNLVGSWVSNTTATYTADQVCVQNASLGAYVVTSYNQTLSTATSGAGGLDTGSTAASTWYYIYAIYGTSGKNILFSTNATTPTMPTGYTYWARIGTMYLDASKNIRGFRQYGRTTQYVNGNNLTGLPIMATAPSGNPSTPTWTTLSILPYVPSTASKIRLILVGSGGNYLAVNPSGSYGSQSNNATNPPYGLAILSTTSGSMQPTFTEMLIESSNIYWAATSGGGTPPYIQAAGYEDNF